MENPKTFEETLTPYIEKLLYSLEKGISLAKEELPNIIQQYIIYEAVISWFAFIISLISFIYIMFNIKKWYSKLAESYEKPILLFLIIPIGFQISGIVVEGPRAILATFFPELFLLKEFITTVS